VLASGPGWCVSAVEVRLEACDRIFEQRHDLAAIAVVTAGSFRYRSHRGTATLAPGAWLLGNAGRDYECAWPRMAGDRAIVFTYAPDCIAGVAGSIAGVPRADFLVHRIPPTPAVLPLGAAVAAQSLSSAPAPWEEIALRMAGEALAHAAGPTGARRLPSRRDEARIGDALKAIERSYDEPLTIADLAAVARMSPYHFLRVFGNVVGVSPHQFLVRTRLRHAAIQLATTSEPVSSIAFGTGFGDLSTFVATFRRVFGMSPRRYRAAAHAGSLRR
jgi:AraC family transcriptional regulator